MNRNATYGVKWMPTYGMGQPFMPTYVPHRRPEEDEVIGSMLKDSNNR